MNPLVYGKFWTQACLPSFLYGAEIYTDHDLTNETQTLSIMVFKGYLLCAQRCAQSIATKTVRS